MKSQCTKRMFGFKKTWVEMNGCTVLRVRICSRFSKQILMNYLESGFPLSEKLITFVTCLKLKQIIVFIKVIWPSDVLGDVFLQVVL